MTCIHGKDHCPECNRYLCFDDYAPDLYDDWMDRLTHRTPKNILKTLRNIMHQGSNNSVEDNLIGTQIILCETLRTMLEVQDLASVSELEAHFGRKDKVDMQGVSGEESGVED